MVWHDSLLVSTHLCKVSLQPSLSFPRSWKTLQHQEVVPDASEHGPACPLLGKAGLPLLSQLSITLAFAFPPQSSGAPHSPSVLFQQTKRGTRMKPFPVGSVLMAPRVRSQCQYSCHIQLSPCHILPFASPRLGSSHSAN